VIYLAFLTTIGAFLVFLKVKSAELWFLAVIFIGVLQIETERGQLASIFSYNGQFDSFIVITSYVSAGALFLVTLLAERERLHTRGEAE